MHQGTWNPTEAERKLHQTEEVRLSTDYSDRRAWIKMLRVQMEQGDHAYKDFQVYGSAWNVSSPTSQRKG
jgi:hypothetical protein